ncbi:acyl dehydratase : Acyl dehydratase OS=Singulisphaera acidiphila (strain ATCC BAA-1392 / DSM 18658 / VKM B-2454 / MOB10) GN=Sinac_1850 PE=4 SV=1: MaoC_dehydratas [Gemmataceae bacterium]|nr:acyl dehydratase : Acyl dehydratase OS=Singulisphaera acidiphila (strain ATCC BAA-1392 / DSM 18658 / VKM B-2454 / MOB10) GN=Sinac_1850 PE=4 SV=1: MaoC_dehydratas [Gemmataceae bacterium]VTT98687.1 acyl dehydratase : Acyl dehydratase OS=Singulisphaera acidiphila (strain ATCC BAA-1392 / DSM 18658 / VKM B-2454 / MOB10) GN=Sinac_1850 PE=4 SV=1: MaoC_dehydratas [Gemmataceae bacterium]
MAFSAAHLFFDDLDVNQEWVSGGRTVTEADIVHFAGFSGDFNPIHVDAEFAKTTPFRKPIAHGFAVFSIGSGLGVMAPQLRTIAMLRVRYWNFILPVFAGDTIKMTSRVIEKTLRGRGKRGEVVWQRSISNQDGKVVQEGEIVLLIEARPLPRPATVAANSDCEVQTAE